MNVSEYVVNQLTKHKIDTIFSVTGGGSMYLVNAFGKNKKFKNFYLHPEQSCAMAADVYARVKKKPAVGLKGVKEDLLKIIDKLESLEQKILNVSYRVKRLEQRVGMI